MRKIRTIVILFFILLLTVASFYIYRYTQLQAVDSSDTTPIVFTVSPGDSPEVIAKKLYDEGLVKSVSATNRAIKKLDVSFYANSYALSPAMTTNEILTTLDNPTSNATIPDSQKLVIKEGEQLEEVATDIEQMTNYSKAEVLAYWSNKEVLTKLIDQYWFLTTDILNKDIKYPLEGYLAPATYVVTPDMTMEEITTEILDKTMQELEPYRDMTYPNDYSINQIMTLASIIEAETKTKEDKYQVAGVFYNRLNTGMPIQSDVTVLYALGEHKSTVTYEDLEVNSPYNTYKYKTLPPGPIANPSITSIDAAINPAENDFIYFYADSDTGAVTYNKTLEEHQKTIDADAK